MLQQLQRLFTDHLGQPRDVTEKQAYEDGWNAGLKGRESTVTAAWPPALAAAWSRGYEEGRLVVTAW